MPLSIHPRMVPRIREALDFKILYAVQGMGDDFREEIGVAALLKGGFDGQSVDGRGFRSCRFESANPNKQQLRPRQPVRALITRRVRPGRCFSPLDPTFLRHVPGR